MTEGDAAADAVDAFEDESAAGAPARTKRDRSWWLDRLVSVASMGLVFLWIVVGIWALRLGESLQIVWLLTSGLHLLLGFAWISLAVGVWQRRRLLIGAAAITVLVQLAVAWPLMPWKHGDAGSGRGITIGSFNVYEVNPDVERVGRMLLDDPPDVLVLQEYSLEAHRAFEQVGLVDHYRYAIEHPDRATSGTAVYSRFPLRELRWNLFLPAPLAVLVTLPDGSKLRLLDVHVFPPQPDDGTVWRKGMQDLDRRLRHVRGPWMAIGDFNATSDHRVFRDMLRDGRRDAHAVTGRGYARSWPANKLLPPLFLIDHAIVSPGIDVVGTRERTMPGSDHRMIEVDIAR